MAKKEYSPNFSHEFLFNGDGRYNLTAGDLIEEALSRNEGYLSDHGALVVDTGKFTGRSPNDKYIVMDESAENAGFWWEPVNQPISVENFERLFAKVRLHLTGKTVFIQDLFVGANPSYTIKLRVVTEKAWHGLFAQNMFIRPAFTPGVKFVPDYTLIDACDMQANPAEAGTRSGTFIVINFSRNLILIGGTSYAGEIKKSVFSLMNYILPQQLVLPMHCAANIGVKGDTALFFGLSGTGKTTLSSDPKRPLIGDDEHGWSPDGVFNFEGGCYAKTIHLEAKLEPLIWSACQRSGAILENVLCDRKSGVVDFHSSARTENTRSSYPISFIDGSEQSGLGGHPRNIFFLSSDAFGVLPLISRLTTDQVLYYFLSGYTAKLAGTEKDLGRDPQATFSACFGEPFLPLHPKIYADLLNQYCHTHNPQVWLVNTGWAGGSYGIGSRYKLPLTRAAVQSVLDGGLSQIAFHKEDYFGLWIPDECLGIPREILDPSLSWKDSAGYSAQARKLARSFSTNFDRFNDITDIRIRSAGPEMS